MMALQTWLDITANNLANANTTGFKQDSVAFKDALETQINANGGTGSPLGTLGTGPVPAGQSTSFELGPIQQTGNALDLSINSPNQMFAVKTPNGTRFTRDGAFTLNDSRELVTQDGMPVLDDSSQPIILPTGTPSISNDGVLSVTSQNKTESVATIGLFQGNFQKEGLNRYIAGKAVLAQTPQVTPNSLEGSNVNAVLAMTDLIKIQRNYELIQKSVTQSDTSSQQMVEAMN